MSCYNVRLVEYPSGLQLRVYNRPVKYSDKAEKVVVDSDTFESSDVRTFNTEHSKQVSVNRTINTIYELARSNVWSYFLTLTIDPAKLENTIDNYEEFSKIIRKYFNNLKSNYAPDLKYLIIPELHADRKKIHFHALIANVGNITFTFNNKVSVGKYIYDFEKCPWGRKIYNMPLWKFGWSTATLVEDSNKVAGYVCKYITKDLLAVTKGKRRFWGSLNLERCKEKFFTLSYSFVKKLLEKHDHALLYSKLLKVSNAGFEIMYFEFDSSLSVSDFEEKNICFEDMGLVSQEEMAVVREKLIKYSKEMKGFRDDLEGLGKQIFSESEV